MAENNKVLDDRGLASDMVHRPSGDEFNLFNLLKVVVTYKKQVFFITLISTIIAIVIAILSTSIYRAEVLLVPVSKKQGGGLGMLANQFGGLASLAGININRGGGADEAIATLKSRELTNKFIQEEGLLPILFGGQWDTQNNQWRNKLASPTIWKAYRLFDKSIRKVTLDKRAGLITLSIQWKDPERAANWANELVYRVNDKLRKEAILEAEKTIAYLEKELQKTSIIEIKNSIYKLIEGQTKNKMFASTQQEYAFRVLDKAVVPEKPIKPKRKLIVMMGFLFGVIMSFLLVLILENLKKYRNKHC